MNFTTYIFGKLSQEYFQYPNDYTRNMFQTFYTKAKAKTQILIHRQDNLMYYSYIRKLDAKEPQYIGMCIVLNSVMFEDIEYLFKTFEKSFIYLALASEFLTINSEGNVIQTGQKYLQLDEISAARDILEKRICHFNNKLTKLPPLDYSKSSSEENILIVHNLNQNDIASISKYSYTYIYKDKNYDTPSLQNYKTTISRLNTEKEELNKKYNELSSKYNRLFIKKKQYLIIPLLLALSLFLFESISNKKSQIMSLKKDMISLQNNNIRLKTEVNNKQHALLNKEKELQVLKDTLAVKKDIEKSYRDLKRQISLPVPLLITDIKMGNEDEYGHMETFCGNFIFSSSAMFLIPCIKYIGIYPSRKVTLYIRIYSPDGNLCHGANSPIGYTMSYDMYTELGVNTQKLIGWGSSTRGLWESGRYIIEVWYDNMCLHKTEFPIL